MIALNAVMTEKEWKIVFTRYEFMRTLSRIEVDFILFGFGSTKGVSKFLINLHTRKLLTRELLTRKYSNFYFCSSKSLIKRISPDGLTMYILFPS